MNIEPKELMIKKQQIVHNKKQIIYNVYTLNATEYHILSHFLVYCAIFLKWPTLVFAITYIDWKTVLI